MPSENVNTEQLAARRLEATAYRMQCNLIFGLCIRGQLLTTTRSSGFARCSARATLVDKLPLLGLSRI